ncbi:arsenate-mycothiol transferase ArsC [Nonomuraea antri]|uniref:arsenate-mycothiol transferase ArsC n=1 Tax=Nonomuraea antri TaxID=2730852 RepID=UPI001F4698EC|nr:arsenate reductase ArsC [Nonomuraea antri]
MLRRIAQQLLPRFPGIFSIETVERYVTASYQSLAHGARVREHLFTLTERLAEERLTALAQTRGAIGKPVCEVLFVCTHNAGRSQIAAALTRHHARGQVNVRAAGTHPADEIEPAVLEALAGMGAEVGPEFPKPLTDEVVLAADVIVSMGCGDACPIHPGKRYLNWDFSETRGRSTAEVRELCLMIDLMVRDLLDELVPRAAER